MLTGVGAAVNSAQVVPDDRVVVFGLGGVGLAALLGAQMAGAAEVVAVDVVEEKLEHARRLGAMPIHAGEGAVEAIREATGGGGDKVIETVGSARVLAQAYEATRRGGTTVTVGLPHPEQRLDIQAVSLVTEERTLKGSYLGSCVPGRDIPIFIEAYERQIAGAGAADAPHRPRRSQRGLRPPRRRRRRAPGGHVVGLRRLHELAQLARVAWREALPIVVEVHEDGRVASQDLDAARPLQELVL